MLLNNAPRIQLPKTATYNNFLGPNTFECTVDPPVYPHKVPFLTSTSAEPVYFNPNYCESLIYGVKDDMKDRRMGTSPSNKAPRVLHDISPGAPVTKYTAKEPSCPGAFDNKDEKKLRKFYVCRTPYSTLGQGPSVPSERHKLGYYINEFGRIIQVPSECKDRTGGPAKYGSNMKKTAYDQKYKGIQFKTSPREPRVNLLPGPADYNRGDLDFHRDPRGDEIRETARFMTFLPRYIDKLQIDLIRDGPPGPADFETSKPLCKRSPAMVELPFVTGVDRFPVPYDRPGPTDYTIVEQSYPISKLNVPFSNLAERFPPKKPVGLSGPSDYQIPSPINEKVIKALQEAHNHPPFGQSAKRILTKGLMNPGPADYNGYAKDKTKKKQTWVFRSKTQRWPYQGGKKYDYLNLTEAYECLLNKKPSSEGNVPFLTGGKRKGFFDILPTPPSTKYCYKPPLPCKGYYLPNAERFPEDKNNYPGPGAYLMHPVYTSSMYGAYNSFNLKLKERAVKMAFRVHPKETWALWAKETRKKRKLKWFYKDGKEYVHCVKDMKPYWTK